MKIARIVYLSMVRFRLLRLFMFIQKMDVRLSVSVYGKFSATLFSASKCQNQHRLLQGKNHKENRGIFALLLC